MPELVPPAVRAVRLGNGPPPRLTVDELVLRPWTSTDAADLVEAYRDPDIRRWHVRSLTNDEAHTWIADRHAAWSARRGADWAVCVGDGLAGRVALRTLDLSDGCAELAYWVVPAHRGKAIAPRAVRALTDWLFEEIGLARIELLHSVDNVASCRVAAKAGYALEGTKRAAGLHADGRHDMHLHATVNPSVA